MQHRQCNICNVVKPISEFGRAMTKTNTRYTPEREFKNWCKTCDAAKQQKWREANPNWRNHTRKGLIANIPDEDKQLMSFIRGKVRDAKERTQKRGLPELTLTADEAYEIYQKQEGKCAYTGVKMLIGKHKQTVLSLDQIDAGKGYTKDNTQWVCWAVNRAKGDMSHTMFINMCAKVTEKCNDYRKLPE